VNYYKIRKGENRSVATNDEHGFRLCGSRKLPRVEPAPGTVKECSLCHDPKPIGDYGTNRRTPDLHDYYCKDCRASKAKRLYHARKVEKKAQRWTRLRGDTLLTAVAELLEACAEARHCGLWRGREAIRAYKRLGDALDEFQRDGSYDPDAMEREVLPLEHAPETDTDYSPDRHATPERYRGSLG
jgi:hypothetical protein